MNVKDFVNILGADFFAGVPDSQLKALCNYLMDTYGIDTRHHIIAANEGNCCGLAAGYHLATGRVPVVYMQNSGEGNAINPMASLLHREVYGIPVIFVVGWRGQPGIHDEPQHVYQGQITLKLLEDMGIPAFVITPGTGPEEAAQVMEGYREQLADGRCVAFIVAKGGLAYEAKTTYQNGHEMRREEVLRHILRFTGEDAIVSTTGKASRELFELREQNGQGHRFDFLTVGSMGHGSSIALGVASQTEGRVWCIDGDGAALMHLGAMAVIGAAKPRNLVHIVINNEAHESVGGMPTVAGEVDFVGIAKACGYRQAYRAGDFAQLDKLLEQAREGQGPFFLEALCAVGSRGDLGRPTTTPQENKAGFMRMLQDR